MILVRLIFYAIALKIKYLAHVASKVCGVSKRYKGRKENNVWLDKEVQEAVSQTKKL